MRGWHNIAVIVGALTVIAGSAFAGRESAPAGTAGAEDGAVGRGNPPAASAPAPATPNGPAAGAPIAAAAPESNYFPSEYDVGQDDWSGGPGEAGPVSDFGDRFDTGEDINYGESLRLAVTGGGCINDYDVTLPELAGTDAVRGLAVARVNVEDQYYDIVAGTAWVGEGQGPHRLRYWLNDGPPWNKFPPGKELFSNNYDSYTPVDLYADDCNNDGQTDIVALTKRLFIIYVQMNGLWPPDPIPLNMSARQAGGVVAANMDGDDPLELVVGCLDEGYSGNGLLAYCDFVNSNWSLTDIDIEGVGYSGVAVADFDDDGDLDIIATGPKETAVFETLSQSDERVWRKFRLAGNGSKVAVGDFNGDGLIDAVVSNDQILGWSRVVIYMNKGSFGFDPYKIFETNQGQFFDLGAADLDGDNDIDVAICGPDALHVWYNDGDGPPGGKYESYGGGTAPRRLDIGDLDGDGDLDVVTGNEAGEVHWFEFGGTFADAGNLVSSVLDTGGTDTEYLRADWDAVENGGTIIVKARTDNNPSMANAPKWEDCSELTPGWPITPGGSVRAGDRYFQYRVSLTRGEQQGKYYSPQFDRITFELYATDEAGPKTSELKVSPDPVEMALEVRVEAKLSDWGEGNSNVVAGEVFVDEEPGPGGSGAPLTPNDGAWDSPIETVHAAISTAGWGTGTGHKIYIRGLDSRGNWGSPVNYTIRTGTLALFPASRCFAYPNPARGDKLRVRYFVAVDAGVKLEVFDIRGRRVAEAEGDGVGYRADNELTVDISSLAPDIYVFRATATARDTGERATVAKKFVVIK